MVVSKAKISGLLRRFRGDLLACLLVSLLIMPSASLRCPGIRGTTETETTLEETEDTESLATTQMRRFQRKRNLGGLTTHGRQSLLPPESAHRPSCRNDSGCEPPVRSFAKRNESGAPLRC